MAFSSVFASVIGVSNASRNVHSNTSQLKSATQWETHEQDFPSTTQQRQTTALSEKIAVTREELSPRQGAAEVRVNEDLQRGVERPDVVLAPVEADGRLQRRRHLVSRSHGLRRTAT